MTIGPEVGVAPDADLEAAGAAETGLGVALEILDVDDQSEPQSTIASNALHLAGGGA
ncbi:hypothetical protein ACI2LF_30300 [Kribbella sp. NPDC020789]